MPDPTLVNSDDLNDLEATLGTAALLDASLGGNGAADSGKVAQYSSTGALNASFMVTDSLNVDEASIGSLTVGGELLTTVITEHPAVQANTAKITNATHTGDVTGATALTIAAAAVSNTKLANMATGTIKGRNTAGTGVPEDLSAAQALALIGAETPAGAAAKVAEAVGDGSGVTDPTAFRHAIRGGTDYRFSLPNTMVRQAVRAGQTKSYHLCQLICGDSFAVNLEPDMDARVAKNAGQGGLVNTAYFGGSGAVLFSGNICMTGDYSYSPTGCWIPLTSGQLTNFGGAYGTTGFHAHRMDIFYSTITGGGSFRVEQKIGSGAWTDLTTGQATAASPISTAGGATRAAGVLTVNWNANATDTRLIRIIGVSGTASIIGARYRNVTEDLASVGGTEIFDMSQGGGEIANTASCPQSIFTTLMSVIQPHFATWKGLESIGAIATHLPTYMNKVETGMGGTANLDWVLVGTHPYNSDQSRELNASDIELRTIANTRGVLFVDMRGPMPPWAQYKAPIDFSPDGLHLGPYGINYQNAIVMRAISDVVGPGRNMAIYSPARNGIAVENAPYAWDRARVMVPNSNAASSALFEGVQRESAGVNYRYNYGQYLHANGSVDEATSRCFGDNNYIRELWTSQFGIGGFIDFGGTSGAGYGNSALPVTRTASAVRELHSGNDTTRTLGSFSSVSGHTGDAWGIYKNASATNTGTLVAKADSQTGKQSYLGGLGNSITGTFTLVAGVATISTTAAATNDHINVTIKTPGGTMGTHYKVTIVNATSLTITAIDTAGATVTTDTSTGTWEIAAGRF